MLQTSNEIKQKTVILKNCDSGPKTETLRSENWDPGTWDLRPWDMKSWNLGPQKCDPGTLRLATDPHHRLC